MNDYLIRGANPKRRNRALSSRWGCLAFVVLACLISVPLSGLAAEWKVSAVLEPAEVTQGQDAVLHVSLAGTSKAKVTLPEVQGVQITYAGQSTQIQIVNFSRMDTVTYIYRVSGFNPGTYKIPAITVEADGATKQTQELSLTVLKGAGADPGPGPEVPPGKEEKVKIEPAQGDQPYFLQMDMKEERLYAGQVVPVTLRLFFRVGYQFNAQSLPTLNSEAFLVGNLSTRPQTFQMSINGVPYHQVVWNTTLTAVKAGDYTLEFKQDAEVQDRDRVLGGGSGLFDQLIARSVTKPVVLKSRPAKVSVLALPRDNRPASFSGAIGSFTFVGQAAPLDVTAGEPMELTVAIEGSGNFDRIDWPGMTQNRLWRSYPPASTFKAADAAGLEGKKTYKQALIPLSAEIKEIPMQEFSYFDPVIGQYKTLRSDPIVLKVRASADSTGTAAGQAVPAPSASSVRDDLGLLPNRLNLGATEHSLKGWMSRPWFWWVLVIPGLCLLASLGCVVYPYVRGRLGEGDVARGKDRLLAQEIQSMQSALQQSDSETFVKKARRVLQQALARQWNCPPDSVTRHEVRQRQPQGGQELEALFAGLDAVDYSGADLGEEEMQRIYSGIQSWLQSHGKGGNHG